MFDALTHERLYKRAWPIDEAMAEIHRESNQQFDPGVVEALLRVQSEVQAIQEGRREQNAPQSIALAVSLS
ncbi:MAG: hypothetical protein JO316_21130 [Abitibacteriaceae bacterium]|nr:hypothetical protein [Abditibacteriaceae bacterium]MBV9867865.1 hypothetical protein [Abditibacteriaceae bacterium]